MMDLKDKKKKKSHKHTLMFEDQGHYLLNNRNKLRNVYPAKTKLSLSQLPCFLSLSSGHHPFLSISFPLPHRLPAPSVRTPTLTPTWFISGQPGSGHGNTPRRWLSQQRATEALLLTSVSGGERVQ